MIARDIRFQVCMATPLAHLWAYVDPEHQPVVEQPLLAGFAAEIEEILAVVPAAELAIQWDMPHDILSIEGNRKLHVDVSHAGLRQRWSELVEKIPAAAELGFHFCYGDSGGKHSIEPRDTRGDGRTSPMTSPLRSPGRSAISTFRFRSSDPTRGSSLR